jgi:class 3 adenylate cyclase/tetratricopeptide (TPR) repeat protein
MECVKCGAVLSAKASFCSVCGMPVKRRNEKVKDVSVLYVYLQGYPEFGEGLTPDELAELNDRCTEALDASVERFGGTVNKHLSGGLVAFFGEPVRREKDSEMVVRVGLDMLSSFGPVNDEVESRAGIRLGLRIGIATGSVHLSGVGFTDEDMATSEVVNLAKKIEEEGETGLCLVDENTYRLTSDMFEYEIWSGDPSSEVWVAKAAKEVPLVMRRIELVDRQKEKTALLEALEPLGDGKNVSVSVVGPVGVGKTALVSSVLSEFDPGGFDLIVCEGVFHARKVPFAAWTDVVSSLFTPDYADYDAVSIVDLETDDDWWPLVAEVFGVETVQRTVFGNIDPEAKRDIALQLVTRKIIERSLNKPIVIVVENAQWVDESSLELLRMVNDASTGKPVKVIVIARDEDPVLCDVTIDVGPLGEDAARELLLRRAEILIEKPVYVEKAVGLAAGNAYYLCELAKSVRAADAGFEVLKIPSSVRGMIQARLNNLGWAAPALVKKASVLGQTFEIELLREITEWGENEFDEALGCLYREGILEREKDRLRFVNLLDQEIALGMVERKNQVEVNMAAAETLARSEDPLTAGRSNRIARYYLEAGEREKAIKYLRSAGLAAYQAFDVNAAKYFLEQARTICIEEKLTDKQAEVTLDLADILRKRTDIDRAISLLKNDASLVTEDKAKGDYLAAQGLLLARLERLEEAETCLSAAAEYFKRAETENELAHALLSLARVEALTGRSDAALANIEKSLSVFEETGDKLGMADVHNLIGFVYCLNERYDEAAPEFEESLRLWKETDKLDGVVMVLNNLAGIRSAQGDYETSVKVLMELVKYSRLMADNYNKTIAFMNLGGIYFNVGNLKAADSSYRDVEDMIEKYKFDDLKGPNLSNGIALRSAQGRYEEALEMINGFSDTPVAETREYYIWLVKIYKLEAELKLGKLTAEEFVERAEQMAPEFDKQNLRELRSDFYTVITDGYISLGMLDKAERAFSFLTASVEDEPADGALVSGLGSLESKLLLAKGDYGGAGKKAVAVFKDAKAKGNFRYMAESLWSLARALYVVNDERWETYADEAVKVFGQLEAEPLVDKIRGEFNV